jgi:hypothetical protein
MSTVSNPRLLPSSGVEWLQSPPRAFGHRGPPSDRLADIALVLLLATAPLEGIVIASSPLRIPVYIVALPIVSLAAFLIGAGRWLPRDRLLWFSVLAWTAVAALSLVVWLLEPPPMVDLSSEYGTLRSSRIRGPLQLGILCALLAALPLTLALARTRLRLAVGTLVGVGALIAAYTVYQAYALRWNLPFRNINNDALSSYSAHAEWNGIFRPRATFQEPAPLGQYLLSVTAVAGSLAVWLHERKAALIAWAATLVLWSGFIVTLSVGAWLGVFPLLVTMLLGLSVRGGWIRFGAVVASLAAVTLAVLTPLAAARDDPGAPHVAAHPRAQPATPSSAPEAESPNPITGIAEEVTGTIGALYDRLSGRFAFGATETRWRIIKHQLGMWWDRPLLGVGLGAADLYLSELFTPGALPSTYGVWWGTLSETGTLGLLSLLGMLAVAVHRLLSAVRRRSYSIGFPIVVGALGGVLADFTAYLTFGERVSPHVWALLGVGLAAAVSVQGSPISSAEATALEPLSPEHGSADQSRAGTLTRGVAEQD